MRIPAFLLLLLLLLPALAAIASSPVSGAAAQDVAFRAEADRTSIAMGERLEVSFILSGSQSGRNFRPPDLADWTVLSGPNQSSSFQMINGSVSTSLTFTYLLQPRKEGSLTVGAATIEEGGNRYTTAPLTIAVAKAAPGGRPADPRAQAEDLSGAIGDNLFLRLELDRRAAWQGEQITATYKIYTRVNVVNYNLAKVPSYTGFWSEELEVPQQVQLTTETLDGKQYRVGVLKKVALFPQRSGTLEVGPMEVECVVQVQSRRRSNDIFDQFFNDPFFGNTRTVNHTVRSRAENVTIRPLPSDGAPEGFSGAVGKYTMEAWADREQAVENDPVTFRVKISGTGNIRLLEAPELKVSTDFDRYDPKVSDQITKGRTAVGGSRTFEYLLIPRHAGEQRIPPVTFSYFDPSSKGYATLRSRELRIPVTKGTGQASAAGGAAGLNREEIRLLGEDIRFIKGDAGDLRRKGERFAGSPLFFVLAAGPIALLGLFLVVARRREQVLGDVAGLRARKARNVARRRLAKARELLTAGESEAYHAEVSRALWGYAADKLGIPPAGLSIDAVRAELERRGARPESTAGLAEVIGRCDFARFAPPSDQRGMEDTYATAERIILELEGRLK